MCLFFLSCFAAASGESTGCPCLSTLDDFGYAGALTVTLSSQTYVYDAGYGTGSCAKHDENRPPFCEAGSTYRPAWCEDSWCYVDRMLCDTNVAQSSYFSKLFYSYATCGASNTFQNWFESSGTTVHTLPELVGVTGDYLKSAVADLETREAEMRGRTTPCPYDSSCKCCGCEENSLWAKPGSTQSITFEHTTTMAFPDPHDNPPVVDQCLVGTISASFIRVALKEADRSRIGYEYYGSQLGSYTQWPGVNDCKGNFDPRFRPWYAAAASGPKDVVVVIDISGSMQGLRIDMARESAIRIINYTLTEADYASVVLFSSTAIKYSSTLRRMTERNRADAAEWISKNVRDGGTTNFRSAFAEVWNIFGASGMQTSRCNRVVLFLSDGRPNQWEEQDYTQTAARTAEFDGVHLLTYALGSSAPAAVLKRLACENRGVFYPVGDNDDLAFKMASYYDMMAQLTPPCQPRFTEYTDYYTGTPLLATCLAAFKKESPSDPAACDGRGSGEVESNSSDSASTRELIGVSCMDMSMIASQQQLQANAGYQSLLSTYRSMNEQCPKVQLSEQQLESLRARVSAQSQCSAASVLVPTATEAYNSRSGMAKVCVIESASGDGDNPVGAIVGALLVVFLCGGCGVYICHRRRRQSKKSPPPPVVQPPMGQPVVPTAMPTAQAASSVPAAIPMGQPAGPVLTAMAYPPAQPVGALAQPIVVEAKVIDAV